MKKVLLTLNNNRVSGIERFTILLAKYINKEKYKVEIGIPTAGPICKVLEDNNIPYFIFNNKKNGSHTVSGILYLFRKIYNGKYDIIHAQAGIVPCALGKVVGVRLRIEHKHGLDFTKEQLNEISALRLLYEKVKKYFTDYTIVVCENDKKNLINKFKYKPDSVKVVYNGIEREPLIVNKKYLKFTIGTIGRLTFQKGQEYLIGAAKILSEKGYDFQYHIYGGGEKYDDFKAMIKVLNLETSVFLKGYTDQVRKALSTFDVFVLPSRYEGIPYVILEAMREDIPVVSTDVGGISEVIGNMRNGILTEKENCVELAKKIVLLYHDKKLRNDLSNAARRDFENGYTIQKTVSKIEEIYSK